MFQVKLCLTFLNMLYVEFFRASWKFHTLTHNGVGFVWLYPPRWILLSSIYIAIYRDKTRGNLYADLFRPKNNSTISLPSTPPSNSTWTQKTDSTFRFSRGKREFTIKEYFCCSAEYGEKENDDLRERYSINKEDFPVYKLFKQNEDTPIDFTGEIKADELSKFVKTNSRLWIGMDSVWKTSRSRVIE